MSHEAIFLFLSILFGLFLTISVGANDLANIVSPAFGSKAITVRQILIIALIFEFGGALLGGGKVSTTIQSGIIDLSTLNTTPNVLIYGMLAALLASSSWLFVATHFGIPVSLTNSIVGAVVGFGTLVLGWHAVHWHMIGFIGLSWILCPVAASIIAFSLSRIVQNFILGAQEPLEQTRRLLPAFLFFIGFILSEITVIKALRKFNIYLDWQDNILLASFTGMIIALSGHLFLKRVYNRPYTDSKEQFALVEKAFSILMILTTCAIVYAHGSDDIASATGPVAAVINLLHANSLAHGNKWLLLILTGGYCGVIIGFLTYGRKVVATVGSNITELNPSRAFCATIAAASTVVTSTNIGIPVSATQTLVGAILGVGLARGIGALDLRVVRNIFASWFITIPVTAILTAGFFYAFRAFFQH